MTQAAVANSTTQRRERYESLVQEAEAHLKRNPEGYPLRLSLLTGLGYGYFYGVLLSLIPLAVGLLYGAYRTDSILLVLAASLPAVWLTAFSLAMFNALRGDSTAQVGHRIRAKECPQLFAELRHLRARLNSPPIHRVLVTQGFNAYMDQAPLLGVFGRYRSTLLLGLPLMLSLTPEGFRSVLAHELGHLAGRHCRFGAWVRRVRTCWILSMPVVERAGPAGEWLFRRFFDWHDPILQAYFSVFVRVNEHQADAMAARVTSRRTFAETLAEVQVSEQLLNDRFWDRLTEQCETTPVVNRKVYTELHDFIRSRPFSEEERQRCLSEQLESKTDREGTHPSLQERLKPLVERVTLPEAPRQNAAEAFLGEQLAVVLQELDRQWAEENAAAWKERHTYVRQGKEALQRLEEKHRAGEMTPGELWDLAAWTEQLKPQTDPLPLYRMAWSKNREDPEAAYAVGRLLLERRDASGVGFLESVIENHPRLAVPACELARDYFLARGDDTAAQQYRLRAETFMDVEAQAEAERAALTAADAYLAHGLERESLEAIREQLEKFENIRHVWICRKQVAHFPDEPMYVLIYQKKGWFTCEDPLGEAVIEQLELPGEYFLICKNGDARSLAKKALKVAERIF